VLVDDMGLGKTLQAIGAMRFLMLRGDVEHTLIIAPTSLLGQWKREIEKFTGLSAVIMAGGANQRNELLQSRPAIAITSYDRMIRDFAGIRHYYRPDLVIADEAQRFKNWQTQASAYIKAIDAPFRFALTGTPMENRLLELYSIVQFVDSTVLGSMWRFIQEYHVTDLRGEPVRPRNVGALRERLTGILLRRERSLVADQLPDRQDIRLLAPLDSLQRDHHDAAVTIIERLGAIARRRPLNPVEQRRMQYAITTARMACDCAGLIDKTTLTSPKLELYAELIEQLCVEAGKKVVVFSQWIRMGELAVMHAKNIGVNALQLYGGVPAERRQAMIDEFANNPDIGVLVCSDAGSTGLNLQMASALIHLDMPWTPAIHEQRSSRIFRLGQKSDVLVYTLLGEASYELHVEDTVNHKARLFAAAVGEGDSGVFDDEVPTESGDLIDSEAPTVTVISEELDTLVVMPGAEESEDSYNENDEYYVQFDDETDDESGNDLGADDGQASTTPAVGARLSEGGAPANERPAQSPSGRVPGASTDPDQGVRHAGRPRMNTDIDARFEQLERVAPAMRVPADALWNAGRRRFATEMLVRGESLKACAAAGDAMPSGWEALTEWWQLRAAAQGFVSVERALVLAQACALLGLPAELFETVVDDAFWAGLLG
jgi:superfamily II DNA or RNA helicase